MYPGGSARDFITVGMPDTAVRESRERIKSALLNSGFGYPNKSVTINLAPANVRKEGAGFDLPMALGILGAMGTVGNQRRASAGRRAVARWHAAAGARRVVDCGVRATPGHPESAGPGRQCRRGRGHRRRARVRDAAPGRSGGVSRTSPISSSPRRVSHQRWSPADATLSGFSRCARPDHGQARARSGGRRRSQRADDRAAGLGQDDARQTIRRHSAAADFSGSDPDHADPQRRGTAPARRRSGGRSGPSARRITRSRTRD